MDLIVLYPKVADSIAGVLLVSSLVKGCCVLRALSTANSIKDLRAEAARAKPRSFLLPPLPTVHRSIV